MSDTIDSSRVKPLREVRKEHILRVLRSSDGDLDRASRILGISLATLRRRIREYGIGQESEKGGAEE